MHLSKYFLPTVREVSSDIKLISHKYALQAGLVKQLVSGIYSWMPMGLRVMKKIENIIREEMKNINVHEILMPSIHPADLWRESGRYDDYGSEMLRIKDRHEKDLLFGPTHEEVLTDVLRNSINSYKNLSMHLFQIQWKFRDEIRPRHGVMRSREFLMKDSYSCDINQENAEQTYHQVFAAYLKIFEQIGLTILPTRADSGAIGGDLSHEFQIISPFGENKIFADADLETLSKCNSFEDYQKYYIASDDLHQDDDKKYFELHGIEIGHLFYFGTKYSQAMNFKIRGADGMDFFPHMGSYGIGVSRLIGAIIEASHDEKGIIWPEAVAPFQVIILNLQNNNEKCTEICEKLHEQLQNSGIEVLYDDTANSAGQKIKNAQLLGIPNMIIIGKAFAQEGKIEMERRIDGQKLIFNSAEEVLNFLKK